MKESLSTDLESGYVEYNDGEKQNKSAMYFWNKPKLYVSLMMNIDPLHLP